MSKERLLSEPAPPADARLAYGPHVSQFLEFRRARVPGMRPLVIMIHGGFWRERFNLLYAGHACAALSEAGFVTANLEYRRVGEAGGGWPGTLEDIHVAAAFARRHAAEFGGDSARCVAMGHSAGGHLALWLAAELQDLSRIVALGPVATLHQLLSDRATVDFLGGTADEVPERYAHADPARPSCVPRVIIHGTEDESVPIAFSRAYAAPAQLIEVPGADHFAVIDPLHPAWLRVLEQVRRVEA